MIEEVYCSKLKEYEQINGDYYLPAIAGLMNHICFVPGEISLFFGNKQVGKSNFIRQLTIGAIYQNNKVLFISPTENKEELYEKLMIQSSAKKEIDTLHQKVVTTWLDMTLAFSDLNKANELLDLIKNVYNGFGNNVVVIDGLEHVQWKGEAYPESFFKELKNLAVELNLHIHVIWSAKKDFVLEKLSHSFVDYIYELERYMNQMEDDGKQNKRNNDFMVSSVRQKNVILDCFKKRLWFDADSQQLLSYPEEAAFVFAKHPIDHMLDLKCESSYIH